MSSGPPARYTPASFQLESVIPIGNYALQPNWMDGHGYETIDQLRGQLSQRSVPDPAAFERANYIKTLASRTAPSR